MEIASSRQTQRFCQEPGGHHSAGAVHRIQSHVEAAAPDTPCVHVLENAAEMNFRRPGKILAHAPDLRVRRLAKTALMVQIQQFTALVVVEEQALRVEHLQGVILGRIMRGGQGQPARGAGGADVDLDGGGWQNAHIHDIAAGGKQTAVDGVLEHLAARARVPAHHHPAGAHIGPKCLGEGASQGGREESAHHATNPGDADLEQVFPGHQAKLLTCSSRASKSSRGGSPRCSQIIRTAGSVWLTRTWNQRPGQSTLNPSSTLAFPVW
jgi:hypothetical protein